MNRREMLKLSLLSGGAVLLSATSDRGMAGPSPVEGVELPTGGFFNPPSPAIVDPFTQELYRMPTKTKLPEKYLSLPENGGVAPNGTVYPQVTGNDATTTFANSLERIVATHQRNSGNNVQFPPKRFYVLRVRQARHIFHPAPPYNNNGGSIIWGYDGASPGPTFMSRYGEPILVRIINELFDEFHDQNGNSRPIPGGFGDPRISTHLHNGHSGSESDGNPADIYPPVDPDPFLPQYPPSIRSIRFRDHHYAMFRAGLDPRVPPTTMPTPHKNDGDRAETVSTLWYHDHSMDKTAANVYKGLVGFHLFFDEVDSGNENDPNPAALRLPSGDFDIPLVFADKRFDADGQLVLKSAAKDPLNQDSRLGVLGDRFTVNGQIQPKLTVLRRRYRFRLLNAGPSRFYKFFLTKDGENQAFIQIGNDESLLQHKYDVPAEDGLLLSVAERADVIIDFRHFTTGDRLFLVNRLVMVDNGWGPVPVIDADTRKFVGYKTLPAGGDQILCFEVGGDAADPSRELLPTTLLRPNPDLPSEVLGKTAAELSKLPNHREFNFELVFGPDGESVEGWVINGRPFDPSPAGSALSASGLRVLPVGCRCDHDNRRITHQGLITPRGFSRPGNLPDGEVWTIRNMGEWAHPVHIHLEEFRILLRNDKPPPIYEKTKKDVLRLDPGEEVQIFLRFRDFLGKYPIHCHNVLHEDHEMMVRFDVVGDF